MIYADNDGRLLRRAFGRQITIYDAKLQWNPPLLRYAVQIVSNSLKTGRLSTQKIVIAP